MTTPMKKMPPAPTRLDMENFAARGDALMTALPDMVDQFNERLPVIDAAIAAAAPAMTAAAAAAASAATALAAPGTNATSTTSLTIGAGTVSMTVQSGKAFAPGAWLNVSRTSDVTKRMLGQVVSYTAGSGALVLAVAAADINGSGTFSDWTVTQSSVRSSVLNAVDLSTLGPSIRPTVLQDFVNSRRLDPRFTYTMTSPLSYYDALGILRTAAPGQVVFDHEPATGVCLGLPIWRQSTNLMLYSEQIDNATWTKGRTTIIANAAVAPDGTMTAEKLVEDTTASATHTLHVVRTGSNELLTYSIYAKAAERTKIYVQLSNVVNASAGAIFDLIAGTVGTPSAASADYSNISARITPVGTQGWFRCAITAQKGSASSLNCGLLGLCDAGANSTYTGDGTSGAYLWGAQLETSSFATPYIRTVGSPVTRAGATLTVPVTGIPYNPAEGAIYVESDQASVGNAGLLYCAAELGDGTNNNLIHLSTQFGTTNFEALMTAAGVVQAGFVSGAAVTAMTKRAVSFSPTGFSYGVGGAVSTSGSGVVPTVSTLAVGCRATGGGQIDGHISKFAYFAKALSAAEIVALTMP